MFCRAGCPHPAAALLYCHLQIRNKPNPICRGRCLHRPACRALSNPPTSNSVARLNFHHHKKHMPAHSAPGICFFCYRTIGNTAQFPPCGLSTAPAAAARHLRCQNARQCRIAVPASCFGSKSPSHSATAAPASVRCFRHWRCSPLQHPVLSALLAWHLPHLARRIGT